MPRWLQGGLVVVERESFGLMLEMGGFLTPCPLTQALNASETLRLLACIELTCYRCKQAVADPRLHHRSRRRIERVIKDDRRRRHKRRQEQDTMIDLFSKQDLNAPDET